MTQPAKQPTSEKPKLSPRVRRILSVLLGVLLGVGCRFVPAAWQGPCAVVVKLIALLTGVNP